MTCFIFYIAAPTSDQLITIVSPTSQETTITTCVGDDDDDDDIVDTAETTSVEVIIDEDGILTASEHVSKRQKLDDVDTDDLLAGDTLGTTNRTCVRSI